MAEDRIPQKLIPKWRAPGGGVSAENREEVAANRAVDGERSGTLEKESEADSAKEDGKFEIHQTHGSASENNDGSDHHGNDAERGQAGEETEEQGSGDEEFGDDDRCGEHKRKAERLGPCGDRRVPAGAAKPAETLLHTVVEKDPGGGEAEDERSRISRGVEEEVNRVVRHGDFTYHAGTQTGSKSVPS